MIVNDCNIALDVTEVMSFKLFPMLHNIHDNNFNLQ